MTTNSYCDLVAAVRRYRPQDLLPRLASLSCRNFEWLLGTDFDALEAARQTAPVWTIAELAKISLCRGNDHRRATTLSARQLHHLIDLDLNLEPALGPPEVSAAEAVAFPLMRLSCDQFTYQVNPKFDMARTLACLGNTQPADAKKRLPGGWAEQVLGSCLINYLQTGFVAHLIAAKNGGILPARQADYVTLGIPEEVLPNEYFSILDKCYTMDYLDRRSRAEGTRQIGTSSRYAFNPLWARPVLKNVPGISGLLVPVPHLVARRLNLTALYFEGMGSEVRNFGGLLGYHFEAYVGANMNLIPDIELHPEISYLSRGSAAKTVDFIAVFPGECILLVEAKAARPSAALRSGDEEAPKAFAKALQKGVEQIERSATMIRDGAFVKARIPANLPIFGIIVTGDAFPLVNSKPVQSWYKGNAETACMVVSIAELEHFVVAPLAHARVLQEAMEEPEHGLTGPMAPSDFEMNPLIERAFEQISDTLSRSILPR